MAIERDHSWGNRKGMHTELMPRPVDSNTLARPVSFPCVVRRVNCTATVASSRTWIQGGDLRALGIAAAREIGGPADDCSFSIVQPDWPPGTGRVFLEVLYPQTDAEALVGPMAGPTASPSLSQDRRYSLEELIALLGVGTDDSDGDTPDHGRYLVTVRHSSIWNSAKCPPVRQHGESDVKYRARCTAADENVLIDRASHQGFHVVQYDIPSLNWTARDLAAVIDLVYCHLPALEPAWNESGWISHNPAETARWNSTHACCCVHVARGDYVASMRLPLLPNAALVEWLGCQRCEIDLHHPVRHIVGQMSAERAYQSTIKKEARNDQVRRRQV